MATKCSAFLIVASILVWVSDDALIGHLGPKLCLIIGHQFVLVKVGERPLEARPRGLDDPPVQAARKTVFVICSK
jgi:hypothetical protein